MPQIFIHFWPLRAGRSIPEDLRREGMRLDT